MGLRVLQAVGNGLLVASAPALVTRAFPSYERGKALGLMSAIGLLGMLIGSLAGGVLVDAFGWRSIFAARVPIGLISIFIALLSLKESSIQGSKQFDFKGSIVLFICVASFILSLTLGGMNGWKSLPVLTLGFLSGLSLIMFVKIQKESENPILQASLLKHRTLSPAFASACLISFATFINFFILPFFVSDILGSDAKTWGILLMLTPLCGGISAPLGGWMSDRMPAAYLTTFGLTVMTVVIFSFTLLDSESTSTMIAVRMACMGIGTGVFQASHSNLVMGKVPSSRLATGGALLTMSRSIGVVTSVAIMSAVLAARENVHSLSGIGYDKAFVMAFQDVYLVSTVIGSLSVLVSILCWPRFAKVGD